jgi:hypothetical protein
MSMVSIRAGLETALNGMSPALATAWENASYSPVPGTPWQMVTLLPAEPDNREMNATHIERGLMQVNLFYPLNAGPGAAETRAELIRETFSRGASFTSSGVVTHLERTPEIAPGRVEDDWYLKPVRVRFYALIR